MFHHLRVKYLSILMIIFIQTWARTYSWSWVKAQNGRIFVSVNIHLLNVTPLLISQNPMEWMCLSLNLTPYCHVSLLYIIGFDFKINYQRIRTTCSHASCCHHCHYCNDDFELFLHVTCYTNSLLLHIHINIA